ncbi:MAG: transposase [Victivallaceae bacterium]|nr:transposase [Victivallaceae bacterium]
MSRKKWTAQEKFQIVMAGLKDRRIVEICNEYGISQGQYYKWRDVLLNDGTKLFERGGVDKEKERLARQNRKLKETIGDLTIELKKNDW